MSVFSSIYSRTLTYNGKVHQNEIACDNAVMIAHMLLCVGSTDPKHTQQEERWQERQSKACLVSLATNLTNFQCQSVTVQNVYHLPTPQNYLIS